jgi:Zn-dependent protease
MVDIYYLLLVFVVILLSMTLHEAMHAYVGNWLGDDTAKLQGRLSLNPLKHIDPFLTIILPLTLALIGAPIFGGAKPVPFNPHNIKWGEWGAALIAIAGPLTNLVIAFVGFGLWVVLGELITGQCYLVLHTLIVVNLGFFVFNMVPITPLEGSRVLYALAPEFVRRGMEIMERYGLIIIFALILLASSYISAFMVTSINFFIEVFSGIFFL